uniref:Methyltransf_11 domain-containing protein n=1 Tax=Strongyloides papillosus TaxID=174720 RepID=A0A0N5BG15_STREA
MDILPDQFKDFATKSYWEKFFKKKQAPFEWYGDYEIISNILDHYIKPSDKILQVGCGSSIIAENLYDNGYKNIESIDTDSGVITTQSRRNILVRPELVFKEESATDIKRENEYYNIVFDKGTLDAMLPPEFDDTHTEDVEKMFSEIKRVLVPTGKYIIVSLLQDHILTKIVEVFRRENQYSIRFHCADGGEVSDFPLPVFVVVITKFKMPMPIEIPMEYMQNSTMKAVKRMNNIEEILDVINSEREFNMYATYKTKNFREQSSFKIFDLKDKEKERYIVYVVDDPNAREITTMAVYVVSVEESNGYLYSTTKGREIIRRNCGVSRLLMFYKLPNQEYGDLKDVNDEVADLVRRLTPLSMKNTKINFVEARNPAQNIKLVKKGISRINGEWKVIDVKISNTHSRQLIFTGCPNLIQSEVYLNKVKGKMDVDMTRLNSQYHYSFLLALSLTNLKVFIKRKEVEMRILVLGIGGGLFSSFLYDFFPKSTIVGVDLDEDVVKIAKNYFKFPTSERMVVHIDDAYEFVKKEASLDKKYDAIFVDIAGSGSDNIINCPPPRFFSSEVLSDMKKCLNDTGVLAINVVTRDEEMHEAVRHQIQQVFSKIYNATCDMDINQVMICPLNSIHVTQTKYPTTSIFKGADLEPFPDCEAALEFELKKLKSLT